MQITDAERIEAWKASIQESVYVSGRESGATHGEMLEAQRLGLPMRGYVAERRRGMTHLEVLERHKPTTAPPAAASKSHNDPLWWLFPVGALLALGGLGLVYGAIWHIPAVGPGHYSLHQLNTLCTTGLGPIAQVFSASASNSCSLINAGMMLGWLSTIAGAIIGGIGIIRSFSTRT